MSTHAKLFAAAIALLALGLLLGFFPIHASTAFDTAACGSAFASNAEDYYGSWRDLCEGKVAMLRYPAIILVIGGLIAAASASYARSESSGSWRNQRVPR